MSTPLLIRATIWLWLIAALLAARFGLLTRLSLTAVPAMMFGLAALVLLAYRRISALRQWIDSLDLRALVWLHVTRFIGIYFLLLARHGMLPGDFALRSGWGDIITATLALAIVVLPLAPAHRLRAITVWNVIGTADLLLTVAAAARLALVGEPLLANLTVLPLSLLPTFLIPVLIATHVILFMRLRASAAPAE